MSKRSELHSNGDEEPRSQDSMSDKDEDDVGPMPVAAGDGNGPAKKRRKVLQYEKLYLDYLPSGERYYKSLMHRDVINHVVVTRTDFVLTTSADGHLKFWKKQESGIEFVKHFRAHLSPIVSVSASADGAMFATISSDGTAKVFDVENFDMINILNLGYTPRACCWIHRRGEAQTLLAISDADSSKIRLYDGRGEPTPMNVLEDIHKKPVHLMAYNDAYDTVISADESGMIEYWQPHEPWTLPKAKGIWEYKSSTDLYDFKKSKSVPSSLCLSPSSDLFMTTSFPDRQVRIFNFLSGKLYRKYDESLTAIQEMQQAGTAVYKLDDMEFGRRLALERDLEKNERAREMANAVFDESGRFVIYATMLGIKVVNTYTNKVVRLLGKDETSRFLNMSLFQGASVKKGLTTVAMAASENPLLQNKDVRDPTLFCTAYKRPRFYLFTRLEPTDSKGERDVFNEKPTREEQTIAAANPGSRRAATATAAILHTTKGDIHLKLFPEHAPKAVENFVGLSRKGYYDKVIFHRVIKKFMLQTGDPLGDGTGGTSVWGTEFEDEFTPALRHDRPYTLSMANAGPNTNGSQFFITTVPTPWLDNKHTIFGRAVSGLDVIHEIENMRTDSKTDKPRDPPSIINVTIG